MKTTRLILFFLLAVVARGDSALQGVTTAFQNTTNSGTLGVVGDAVFGGTLIVSNSVSFGTNLSAIHGPLTRNTLDVTSSRTLDRTNYNIIVSDSAGDVVLTLPTAAGCTGHEYRIAKRAGTNLTTIAAQSGELIGGIVNSIPLPLLTSVTLESNGTQWHFVESPLEPIFKEISATTNLVVGDFNIIVNDTAGSLNINLPSATNYSLLGRKLYIHKRAGTNTTTIDPAGSETVDSATTLVLPYLGSVILQSDLTGWRSVAKFLPPITVPAVWSGTNITITAMAPESLTDVVLTNSPLVTITAQDGMSGGITFTPDSSVSYTVYLPTSVRLLGGGNSFVVTNSASETVNLEWKQTLRGGSSVILANVAVYP